MNFWFVDNRNKFGIYFDIYIDFLWVFVLTDWWKICILIILWCENLQIMVFLRFECCFNLKILLIEEQSII